MNYDVGASVAECIHSQKKLNGMLEVHSVVGIIKKFNLFRNSIYIRYLLLFFKSIVIFNKRLIKLHVILLNDNIRNHKSRHLKKSLAAYMFLYF